MMRAYDLRPARSTDAGQTGEILHRFNCDTPWMPDLHSGAEAIAFCGAMIERGWITVAAQERQILGFIACDGAEICALYVTAAAQGQGIGKALLDHVKTTQEALALWTFEANSGAQRFYLREGFAEVSRTDGQGNDEGLPDIQYRWHRRPTAKTAERPPMSSPHTPGSDAQ